MTGRKKSAGRWIDERQPKGEKRQTRLREAHHQQLALNHIIKPLS